MKHQYIVFIVQYCKSDTWKITNFTTSTFETNMSPATSIFEGITNYKIVIKIFINHLLLKQHQSHSLLRTLKVF